MSEPKDLSLSERIVITSFGLLALASFLTSISTPFIVKMEEEVPWTIIAWLIVAVATCGGLILISTMRQSDAAVVPFLGVSSLLFLVPGCLFFLIGPAKTAFVVVDNHLVTEQQMFVPFKNKVKVVTRVRSVQYQGLVATPDQNGHIDQTLTARFEVTIADLRRFLEFMAQEKNPNRAVSQRFQQLLQSWSSPDQRESVSLQDIGLDYKILP